MALRHMILYAFLILLLIIFILALATLVGHSHRSRISNDFRNHLRKEQCTWTLLKKVGIVLDVRSLFERRQPASKLEHGSSNPVHALAMHLLASNRSVVGRRLFRDDHPGLMRCGNTHWRCVSLCLGQKRLNGYKPRLRAPVVMSHHSNVGDQLSASAGGSRKRNIHREALMVHAEEPVRIVNARGPRKKDNGETKRQELLELDRIVQTLKVDIPRVLCEEPHWGIFAENFTLIDQTGSKMEGLRLTRLLVKLGRRVLNRKDEIDVSFMNGGRGYNEPNHSCIVARLKFQYGGIEDQFLRMLNTNDPIDIEAETTFHVNGKKQIDYMKIDRWLANGYHVPVQLKLWPDVSLSDGRVLGVQKLKSWYNVTNVLRPLPPTTVETVTAVFPTRSEFLRTFAIQALVLFVGKGEVEKLQRQDRKYVDAVESLRADIPNILIAEPDWGYFAEDFTLVDQLGVNVKGLSRNKRLLKLVRNLRDALFMTPLQAFFDAQTVENVITNADGTVESVLDAWWTLAIDLRARIPYDIATSIESQTLAYWKIQTFPVKFAGKSCFRFNEEGKVSSMKIDSWSINGKIIKLPLVTFPNLQFLGFKPSSRE